MAQGAHDIVAEDSRADILKAAAECFLARGYYATSIDDVARSLGSTKGRIYHHFPSKSDLFADVFRAGMDVIYEVIAPLSELPGSALARWRKMALVHTAKMMTTKPFQRAVWIGVEMHLRGATTPEQRVIFDELLEYRTQYGNLFRKALSEGRDEGAFRFDDLSVTTQLMFMTINSPATWYTPRPGDTNDDIERLAVQVVDYTQSGLCGTKGEVTE